MFKNDPKHVFDAIKNYIICGILFYLVLGYVRSCDEGELILANSDWFTVLLFFLIIYLFIWNFIFYARMYIKNFTTANVIPKLFGGVPMFLIIGFYVMVTETEIRSKIYSQVCKNEQINANFNAKLKDIDVEIKKLRYGDDYYLYIEY